MWNSAAAQEPDMNKKCHSVTHSTVTIPCKIHGWSFCITQWCYDLYSAQECLEGSGMKGLEKTTCKEMFLQWGLLTSARRVGETPWFSSTWKMFPEKEEISCFPDKSLYPSVSRNNGRELQEQTLKIDAWQRGSLTSTDPICLARMWNLYPVKEWAGNFRNISEISLLRSFLAVVFSDSVMNGFKWI